MSRLGFDILTRGEHVGRGVYEVAPVAFVRPGVCLFRGSVDSADLATRSSCFSSWTSGGSLLVAIIHGVGREGSPLLRASISSAARIGRSS
jgi:hypothetical protein